MTWLTSLPATVLVISGLLLALLAAIGCRLAMRALLLVGGLAAVIGRSLALHRLPETG